MTGNWAALAQLANLAYENEIRKLAELRKAEAVLTEKRQRLEQMNDKALEAFTTPHPAHWHNGDFLWQNWVAKNEKGLGIEQARMRALSEMHKPKLRKAFGRKSVLEQLARKETR